MIIISFTLLSSGAELIELSPRVGKSISQESRNYFGLFPYVKNYVKSELFKDNNRRYLSFTTIDTIFNINISDYIFNSLSTIIENYEDIIAKGSKTKFKFNSDSLLNYIKVKTIYRTNPNIISVTKTDGTELSGYLMNYDTLLIVLAVDSIFSRSNKSFTTLYYNEIKTIKEAKYPEIYGNKLIFQQNNRYFEESAMFTHTEDLYIFPPEVIEAIKNTKYPDLSVNNIYYPDFDSLYQHSNMLSIDITYQKYNLNGLIINAFCGNSPKELYELNLFSFERYLTLGLNYDKKITKNLRIQLGYNYEIVDFTFMKNAYTNQMISNTINLSVIYNLWHSKLFQFMEHQFYLDIFGGAQFHTFKYKYENWICYNSTIQDLALAKKDITAHLTMSYKLGLNLRYRLNSMDYIYISGFTNFNDYNSYISFASSLYTRYIDYILSYGVSAGFGIEF